MSIFKIVGGRVTHKYLMNKTKHEIARIAMEYLAIIEDRERQISALQEVVKGYERDIDAQQRG